MLSRRKPKPKFRMTTELRAAYGRGVQDAETLLQLMSPFFVNRLAITLNLCPKWDGGSEEAQYCEGFHNTVEQALKHRRPEESSNDKV